MTPLDPRQSVALAAALDRVAVTTAQAAERAAELLALKASAATNVFQRDALNLGHFALRQKTAAFNQTFLDAFRAKAMEGMHASGSRDPHTTDWHSLSLVDDHEVEALVGADRLGQTIATDCEWELRDVDAFMGALLRTGHSSREHNPLRPENIGKALFDAINTITDDKDIRKLVTEEVARVMSQGMRECYKSIADDLRQRGVQPLGLSVKQTDGHARDAGPSSGYGGSHSTGSGHGEFTTSGDRRAASLGAAGHAASGGGGSGGGSPNGFLGGSGNAARSGASHGSHGSHAGHGGGHSGHGAHAGATGTPIGHVDGEMMSLIRRLAWLSNTGMDSAGSGLGPAEHGGAGVPSTGGTLHPAASRPQGLGVPLMAPNIIFAHREELKQASTGTLDHMVIDVVGSLFEQILSDPKVPPQMARQLARLQLPVLRTALGDPTFFSSRRHPVRRFVNRIASLACAFDDFNEDPGARFLNLVKELVQQIVTGDFDQIEVYEGRLQELETFIQEQTQEAVQENGGDVATLFGQKEDQLRQQQRYMRQLKAALEPVGAPEFLRDFISQVWSQAIVAASRRDGPDADFPKRLRRAGRDLVMSVQPKGTPAERKAFLMQLPQLMKDLNEGMALIGWPEAGQKAFFAELLPAHAESLKGKPMTQLEVNLLVKQLDAIMGTPLPSLDDAQTRSAPVPVLDDAVVEQGLLSAEEAQRVGLVSESSVNWDGQVDIDLGAEPEVTAVDINIDGLPPAEPAEEEPMRGKSLVDHLQIGFAYRMHSSDGWQKVRLSHISPGRTFFVFTRGTKHQQIMSMTNRMVSRMCETGRLCTFENAYLLERATARARAQLAALGVGSKPQGPTASLH